MAERTATRTEILAPEPAEALAALLDLDGVDGGGRPVREIPPLWHWVYLLDRRAHRDLGLDGHPTTGIPSPAAPGLRRMFAGGRVRAQRPLVIGVAATRTTRMSNVVEKSGRSGPLTFVTVRHEIAQHGDIVISEEQDLVYRPAAPAGAGPARERPARDSEPEGAPTLRLAVDEAFLFRFSALTYNAHRIHYDRDWAHHEGYPNLVVHGPLQALMMGELLRRNGIGLIGRQFSYRLEAPMFGAQTMRVTARASGLPRGVEVLDAAGRITATSSVE